MKVELLAYTPRCEEIVASAAKLCYSQVGVDEIMESQNKDDVDRFLEMLGSIGHESPIEHVSFTFAIEGVSRALTHQLVRHRMASYSQQSQRYVKLDQFDYVIPPSISEDETARKMYDDVMRDIQKKYDELTGILYEKNYGHLIGQGVEEKQAKKQAEKKAIEDARYVFPNACETKILVTMNARSLKNFFRHRCCERAQWEIREMATKMLVEVKGAAPSLFKNSGPSCVSGQCGEGAMSCGKINEIRTKFKNI